MGSRAKEAGAADAVRSFFGRTVSNVPAQGAAGLAQKLFSDRVKPSNTAMFSRVNFLNAIRDGIFGSPVNVYREMRRYGKTPNGYSLPLALRRFYYRSVVPPGSFKNQSLGMKALTVGSTAVNTALPALELYGALSSSPENRGESVGRAVTSIAAAPFSMRLGLPGIYLDSLAANAGGAIGRQFDRKPPPVLPQPPLPVG